MDEMDWKPLPQYCTQVQHFLAEIKSRSKRSPQSLWKGSNAGACVLVVWHPPSEKVESLRFVRPHCELAHHCSEASSHTSASAARHSLLL